MSFQILRPKGKYDVYVILNKLENRSIMSQTNSLGGQIRAEAERSTREVRLGCASQKGLCALLPTSPQLSKRRREDGAPGAEVMGSHFLGCSIGVIN